jgi:hypothetical protein
MMRDKLGPMGRSPRISTVLQRLFGWPRTRRTRLNSTGKTDVASGDNASGLFDDVPGPSPWYLVPETKTVNGFVWRPAGETRLSSGKTLLVGPNGPVAVLNFQNYVMRLDVSSLLIWHQQWTEFGPTEPVRILVVHPDRLTPLPGDLDSLYEAMNVHRTPITLGGKPTAEVRLETHDCTDEIQTEFPEQMHSADELLILCHSSGIPGPIAGGGSNSALLVARPRQAVYRLYQQNWFNSGGIDYGYQWVTRVVRNHRTGQVHGEGMRIAPFILDDSLCNLRE